MSMGYYFETVPLAEIEARGLIAEEGRHRPVVLIVDEDKIVTDTRAALFTIWGYAAMTAYDAQAALALARVIPPELLVSDVHLSGMNGLQLAIALRHLAPDCKILLFAAREDADYLIEARQAGHEFTVLQKPVHPTELIGQLNRLNLPSQSATFYEAGRNHGSVRMHIKLGPSNWGRQILR